MLPSDQRRRFWSPSFRRNLLITAPAADSPDSAADSAAASASDSASDSAAETHESESVSQSAFGDAGISMIFPSSLHVNQTMSDGVHTLLLLPMVGWPPLRCSRKQSISISAFPAAAVHSSSSRPSSYGGHPDPHSQGGYSSSGSSIRSSQYGPFVNLAANAGRHGGSVKAQLPVPSSSPSPSPSPSLSRTATPDQEGAGSFLISDHQGRRKRSRPLREIQAAPLTSCGRCHFVKARVDGVRICRKIDLCSYDGYDSLKTGLQHLFQAFMTGSTELDILHGNSYVLTHEDENGECFLVGDEPWHVFIQSRVKELRVMKAMADATLTILK